MGQVVRSAGGPLAVLAVVISLVVLTGIGVHGGATDQVPPCQDDDYEHDDEDCWRVHVLEAGAVEPHRLCDPDWFGLDVLRGATYVLETRNLVGGADTTLELWFLNNTGECWVYGPPDLADDDGGSGGGSRLEWVAQRTTWRRQYRVRPQAVVTGKGYGEGMGYELSLECVANCPPAGEIIVFPWVERGIGPGDDLVRTELRLFNPTSVDLTAELDLRSGDQLRSVQLVLAGNHEVRVDDVVAELFGVDAAGGLLQVRTADVALAGVAWVVEERPGGGGRVGHAVPARRIEGLPTRWDEDQAVFEAGGLEESTAVDTTVSIGEVMGLPTTLDLILRAGDGSELGRRQVPLEAHGILMLDDVFGFFGAEPDGSASLEVSGSGMGRVLGQAVLRDTIARDTLSIQQWSRSASRLVPAVASADGAFGARWTSDLVLSAIPASVPSNAWITFLPRDGWNVDLEPVVLTLEPGETRVIEDVVEWLGGNGAGGLLVEGYDVVAWSRIEGHTGTAVVAQQVPAMGRESQVGFGEGSLVLLGVERSAEVRTNVGWINASDDTGAVEVRLVAADGELLGSRTYPLRPLSPSQLNDMFLHLAASPRLGCRAELEVVEGDARILAYASRVDNRSGDAVFVPATHVPRLDTDPVVLSNRDSCVLVDRLPGAVGVDLLPPGAFTASLSGSAQVGPGPFDRLELVCLYHDLDGNLGAEKVTRYSALEGIAGEAPFWCFAPDRVTRDDNSGSATLVVTNGADRLTFSIDAATDAVLLEDLPGAGVVERPHRDYHVLTRGDLGRPGLEPHVVVTYWREWLQSGGVAVMSQGDWFSGAWPGQPLAAVVLDWIDADDNTGASRLVSVPQP